MTEIKQIIIINEHQGFVAPNQEGFFCSFRNEIDLRSETAALTEIVSGLQINYW